VITRRHFANFTAKGIVAFSCSLLSGFWPSFIQAAEPKLKPLPYTSAFTRKGLHTQPWFLNSFLDLKDDLQEATSQGKRFSIIWELAGCPYCRETHLVNFAKPNVSEFISKNFEILQLDLRGSRIVTNFDGKELTERDLAKRNNIRFTPTIQFFSENLEGITGKSGLKATEVSRMPGYFRPQHFLAMFQYIRDKGYEVGDYRSYLKARDKKSK
jgi:thioredoxin-related protein